MAQSIEGRPGITLVVEDDPDVRGMAAEFLEIEGVETLAAANPDEALDIYQTRPPDRLVTDIRMPNPRDGINLVFELIKRGCKIPVLFMSGTLEDVTPDDLKKIQDAGIKTALLRKPFGMTEFTSAVASL